MRLREKPLKRIHLELKQGAFIDIARFVDAHSTLGAQQILDRVIVDLIGFQVHVTTPKVNLATEVCVQIGLPAHGVGLNKGGLLAFGRVGDFFLKERARLEREGGWGWEQGWGRRLPPSESPEGEQPRPKEKFQFNTPQQSEVSGKVSGKV